MSDLSFHLVDRIDDLVPERSARGHLAIPADMSEFPACLVVEAIGQLAAWVAMQRASFERRPVAARAADVRVFGTVPPGARLELEISVQSCPVSRRRRRIRLASSAARRSRISSTPFT